MTRQTPLRDSHSLLDDYSSSSRWRSCDIRIAVPLVVAALLGVGVLTSHGIGSAKSKMPMPTEYEATFANLSSNYTRVDPSKAQVHPWMASAMKECMNDFENHCPTLAKEFVKTAYQAFSCLEREFIKDKTSISAPCRRLLFDFTAASPNPQIFTIDASGPLVNGSDLSWIIGHIQAPLFYQAPQNSPLINVYFAYVPCKTQPAPKGMFFQHNGGPLPSAANAWYPMVGQENDHYLLENYDIVSVDQRGLGMSGVELLYPGNSVLFPASGKPTAGPSTQNDSAGALPMGNLLNSSRCIDLAMEADKDNGIPYMPWDWADRGEVGEFLEKRMRLIVKCSKRFDVDDGEGGTYNPLQWMGTSALAYDIEWLRMAFGAPQITLLGFSYGTRVAAAYAGTFPHRIARVAVTGVMAPTADAWAYAKSATDNDAQNLGFILNQCSLDDACRYNPWNASIFNETSSNPNTFPLDINEALKALYQRSDNHGKWYKENGCTKVISLRTLGGVMQAFLTADQMPYPSMAGVQNGTWPWTFSTLPAYIFDMLNRPCVYAEKYGMSLDLGGVDSISVFYLIPALDMIGKSSKDQSIDFITSNARDHTTAPIQVMSILYALATYGWPQFPVPIPFKGSGTVETIIAQALWDERTGVQNAQLYRTMFTKSTMINSISGGHCVLPSQGDEAFKFMIEYLLGGEAPVDGYTAQPKAPINFAEGTRRVKALVARAPSDHVSVEDILAW